MSQKRTSTEASLDTICGAAAARTVSFLQQEFPSIAIIPWPVTTAAYTPGVETPATHTKFERLADIVRRHVE